MTEAAVTVEQDDGMTAMDMYTRYILRHNIDLASRSICIYGDIEDHSFTKLDKQLKVLEYNDAPITIYLNSYGGCLISQFAIIDRIRLCPNDITIVATGIIASAAVAILASGKHRKATSFTSFMHHGMLYNSPMSKIVDHEIDIKYSKMLERKRFQYLATNSKKPYAWWAATGKQTDYYFDAEEALEIGLIDEIL